MSLGWRPGVLGAVMSAAILLLAWTSVEGPELAVSQMDGDPSGGRSVLLAEFSQWQRVA